MGESFREENMAYRAKKTLTKCVKSILKDQRIVLKNAKQEGMLLRRVEAVPVHEGHERQIQVRLQESRSRLGIGERYAEQLVVRLMDFVPGHARTGMIPATTQIAPPATEARPALLGASRSPQPSKPGSKFVQTATPNGMPVQRLETRHLPDPPQLLTQPLGECSEPNLQKTPDRPAHSLFPAYLDALLSALFPALFPAFFPALFADSLCECHSFWV